MKNIKLISIICIFLMVISFTACKSKDTVEQIEEVPQTTTPEVEEIEEEFDEINKEENSILGKWQTEDETFTYELLEDGKLYVGSQYGVDEDCTWSQDGDRIEFSFSDNAGITYIYDKENDKLICDGDDSWYLVRSEE